MIDTLTTAIADTTTVINMTQSPLLLIIFSVVVLIILVGLIILNIIRSKDSQMCNAIKHIIEEISQSMSDGKLSVALLQEILSSVLSLIDIVSNITLVLIRQMIHKKVLLIKIMKNAQYQKSKQPKK